MFHKLKYILIFILHIWINNGDQKINIYKSIINLLDKNKNKLLFSYYILLLVINSDILYIQWPKYIFQKSLIALKMK